MIFLFRWFILRTNTFKLYGGFTGGGRLRVILRALFQARAFRKLAGLFSLIERIQSPRRDSNPQR